MIRSKGVFMDIVFAAIALVFVIASMYVFVRS